MNRGKVNRIAKDAADTEFAKYMKSANMMTHTGFKNAARRAIILDRRERRKR